MSYDEHLISMAGGDGEADVLGEIEARLVADEAAFREPGYIGGEQCMTDRAYLLAMVREQRAVIERVREAQARAYDKGYTHGRHDGEHHLTYRLSHTPRPEKSRRNPYRAALTTPDPS